MRGIIAGKAPRRSKRAAASPPGSSARPRAAAFYAGCFRDPDGNKLNVFCFGQEAGAADLLGAGYGGDVRLSGTSRNPAGRDSPNARPWSARLSSTTLVTWSIRVARTLAVRRRASSLSRMWSGGPWARMSQHVAADGPVAPAG